VLESIRDVSRVSRMTLNLYIHYLSPKLGLGFAYRLNISLKVHCHQFLIPDFVSLIIHRQSFVAFFLVLVCFLPLVGKD